MVGTRYGSGSSVWLIRFLDRIGAFGRVMFSIGGSGGSGGKGGSGGGKDVGRVSESGCIGNELMGCLAVWFLLKLSFGGHASSCLTFAEPKTSTLLLSTCTES